MNGSFVTPERDSGTATRLALVASAFLASGLLVGLGVTAALEPRIEFSLFLGIPTGVFAGVLVAWGVNRGLTTEEDPRRRSVAWTVGGFSLAFLFSLVGFVLVLDEGVAMSLGLSLAGGLVGGLLAFLFARLGRSGQSRSALDSGRHEERTGPDQ